MATAIRNTVTYTSGVRDNGRPVRMEKQLEMVRPSKLTPAGARVILRRELNDKTIEVVRVEAATLAWSIPAPAPHGARMRRPIL